MPTCWPSSRPDVTRPVPPGWRCMVHPQSSVTNSGCTASIRRSKMFNTKNGLSEATRVKAVELLIARLADCIDLQTQTKHAHWNVKGPNFIALHELFDRINEEVEDYVDDIAERAVQLGGVAEGTARMVAKRSSLRVCSIRGYLCKMQYGTQTLSQRPYGCAVGPPGAPHPPGAARR